MEGGSAGIDELNDGTGSRNDKKRPVSVRRVVSLSPRCWRVAHPASHITAKENLDMAAEAGLHSISLNLTQLTNANGVSHLHHFTLWAFREDQDLVVERIQRLPHRLGLFLGHADAVLQQVNFDVGG